MFSTVLFCQNSAVLFRRDLSVLFFLELSSFYFGRTHSSISIELNSSRSNRIQEFEKELGPGKNSRLRLEEYSELIPRHRS